MALTIHTLDYRRHRTGDFSFLVLGHECGRVRRVPVYGFLILGRQRTRFWSTPAIATTRSWKRWACAAIVITRTLVEQQLARHGLKLGDVRYILHTHLHIDHAGNDDDFPDEHDRRAEPAGDGVLGLRHHVPAIPEAGHHAPGRADLRTGGHPFPRSGDHRAEEIIPGVWCEPAGAHTEGSMNVIVETAEGLACICGDVIYDFNDQIINHVRVNNYMEPQVTGNHAGSKRQRKGADQAAAEQLTPILLPIHDRGAKVENGQVVGRMGMQTPGPMVETLPRRDWFPA